MHPPQPFIPEIDALRCFAMTGVVMLHCGLLPFGWAGVWLFFVISGFVITRSLVSHDTTSPGEAITAFYIRRARRILPLYALYIGVLCLFWLAVGRADAFAALPWLATFTYNVRGAIEPMAVFQTPGTPHLWSLIVEEQFYLLYPFAFFFLPRRWLVPSLVGLTLVSPLIRYGWGQIVTTHGLDTRAASDSVMFFSPGQMDGFALGVLIALFEKHVTKRAAGMAWAVAGISLVAYVTAYALPALMAGQPVSEAARGLLSGIMFGGGREAFVFTVVLTASAAMILSILARQRWALALCAPRPVRWIGTISYGAYVWHFLMLELWIRALPQFNLSGGYRDRLILFSLIYASTVACAAVSFYWYERRFSGGRPRLQIGLATQR
jgi:peptidoglycan/LPS O-acetylase OafA/YrhL